MNCCIFRTVRASSLHPLRRSFITFPRFYTSRGFDDEIMGKEKAEKTSYQLKVPKGTKDWDGIDMVIRDQIFDTIKKVFKRHGGRTIDT
jgi:hypothetical protein